MRAFGYCRVSTRDQVDGYGLEVQRDTVQRTMQALDVDSGQVHFDEGVSGTILDRPGLGDLLNRLTAGDVVVVPKLDRLARDLIVQELLLADIKRKGATLVSCDAGENAYLADDAGDPSRKLIRQILGAVAEYERSTITLRMQAGIRAKKAAGGYAGGQPPYGWTGIGGELVRVESEQRVLLSMRCFADTGNSHEIIAASLNRNGWTTRKGKPWTRQSVRKVLDTASRRVREHGGAVLGTHVDDEPAVGDRDGRDDVRTDGSSSLGL